jgi:hypothetical protein
MLNLSLDLGPQNFFEIKEDILPLSGPWEMVGYLGEFSEMKEKVQHHRMKRPLWGDEKQAPGCLSQRLGKVTGWTCREHQANPAPA